MSSRPIPTHPGVPSASRSRVYPVICENVNTGRIGRHTHGFRPADKQTLCGISAYGEGKPAGFQLSIEPDGTPITCPRCTDG